jgi:chemotaxis protein methyltransferase CheR
MDSYELEKIEYDLLLQILQRGYGYDFSHYSPASFKRRIAAFTAKQGFQHTGELFPRLLRDPKFLNQLIFAISVPVTEMFRDPKFYLSFRQVIIPELRKLPQIRLWHAGCATGEEVYSMAILLQEEGLYDRCQIYATDINEIALDQAKNGIYNSEQMRDYTANYQQSGGTGSLADYYHCRYDSAIMEHGLRKNIVFANHNLAVDGVFGEMHLICCRNVLIYFDRELQNNVMQLFANSLTAKGFLCLGTKETIKYSSTAEQFNAVDGAENCYQTNAQHQPEAPIV